MAVLCQSIYWQTSKARNRINISKVNSAVSNYNNTMRAAAVRWYAYVLFHEYMNYHGDHNNAKRIYMEQLNSAQWVTAKQAQLISGSWNNPSWELFHHWIKLSALGASDAEISSLIGSLKQRGLIIESVVDASRWRNYFVWYHPNNLDHSDVDSEAREGALKVVYIPTGRGVTAMKEENSFEFIAKSQPGSTYWKAPPSSCLSGNTLVVMASGDLKPIKNIRAGEAVKISSGTSKVLLVSAPKMEDRPLYQINNLPFYFTEAHPFLSSSQDKRYAAVSSLKLLNNVPLLGQHGIESLQTGTQLLGHDGSSVTVTSLLNVYPEEGDEFVYDLIIEPSSEGKFEYFAGSENNLFVVASELPTMRDFSTAEQLAFKVIMAVLFDNTERLNTLYTSSSDHSSFLHQLDLIARSVEEDFLQEAFKSSYATTGNATNADTPLPDLIISATKLCQVEDGTFNQASGAAYDLFMQKLFYPIASSLELGHRIVPTSSSFDYLAVSILDFYVVAPTKLPPVPTVHVRVPAHEQFTRQITEGEIQTFGCRFHQTYYLPVTETNQTSYDITIAVPAILSAEKKGVLTATLLVPPVTRNGLFHCRRLLLLDEDGLEQGYINVDVRNLDADHLDAEMKQAQDWKESSQQNLALRIENACKTILTALNSTENTQ